MGYSSGANLSVKNNRSLKKRKGFFKSYKEIEYKHNLKDHPHNDSIKKMSSYEMQILKLKLNRESNFRTFNYIFGISLIVVLTLLAVLLF